MEGSQPSQKSVKPIHGEPWTVEEFGARYSLEEYEAHRLFRRFGPYSVDLEVLMRAKRQRDLQTSAQVLAIEPHGANRWP